MDNDRSEKINRKKKSFGHVAFLRKSLHKYRGVVCEGPVIHRLLSQTMWKNSLLI